MVNTNDIFLSIQIDAEFYNIPVGKMELKNQFITLQVGTMKARPRRMIFEHPDWAQRSAEAGDAKPLKGVKNVKKIQTWSGETAIPAILNTLYPKFNYDQRRLAEGEKLFNFLKLEVNVFYSFADIVALLGRDQAKLLSDNLLPSKTLRTKDYWVTLPLVIYSAPKSKRKVQSDAAKDHGELVHSFQLKVKIKDWFGVEYTSLLNTCLSYNIEMPQKSLMDSYKSNMDVAYADPELRETFISYALADLVLGELSSTYNSNYKELCDLLGIEDSKEAPMTKGSKVARMFIRLLEMNFPVEDKFMKYMDLPFKGRPSITKLMTIYGSNSLSRDNVSLTKRHLAIVLGGRIRNEQPDRPNQNDLIISMDLESCYGKALENNPYPIGHPVLLYYTIHRPEEWISLESFIDKWESELVDNCWYCVIDTVDDELSFSQDVFFSKYLGPSDSPEIDPDAKTDESFASDDGHVKGSFMLLEKQIHNGILTSSSLSILRCCSSDKEWGELKSKIRIKAAMIYPKSLRVEYTGNTSYKAWLEACETRSGKIYSYSDIKGHHVHDERVGPWLEFPLSRFISPLLKKRKEFKQRMKEECKGSDEFNRLHAFQLAIKGVVNTLYGTMASPYFDSSSPCVANNITDMARMACWLMSKAAKGLNSITDGCESLVNSVRFWKNHAPSINTLTNLTKPLLVPSDTLWKDRVWEAPLGSEGDPSRRWSYQHDSSTLEFNGNQYTIEGAKSKIAELYKHHLFHFFRYCDNYAKRRGCKSIDWAKRYGIECKTLGLGFVGHGVADYMIGSLDPNEAPIIKARGHKLNSPHYDPETGKETEPSMKGLMSDLFNNKPMTTGHSSMYKKPLSVGEFKRTPKARDLGLLPGDTILKLVSPKILYFPNLHSTRWRAV